MVFDAKTLHLAQKDPQTTGRQVNVPGKYMCSFLCTYCWSLFNSEYLVKLSFGWTQYGSSYVTLSTFSWQSKGGEDSP